MIWLNGHKNSKVLCETQKNIRKQSMTLYDDISSALLVYNPKARFSEIYGIALVIITDKRPSTS